MTEKLKPKFQIGSSQNLQKDTPKKGMGLRKVIPPSQEQKVQPQKDQEQERIREMMMEVESLQNTGYFRYNQLAILSQINKNLNGIGKMVAQIGQTIDKPEGEQEEQEGEEEGEQEDYGEEDGDNGEYESEEE